MIQHPFIRRSKIGKLLSLVCCISAGKTYTGLPVLMLLSLLLVVAGRLINLLLLLIPASSMEHNLLLAQPTVQRHRVGPAGSQHLAAQGERGRRSSIRGSSRMETGECSDRENPSRHNGGHGNLGGFSFLLGNRDTHHAVNQSITKNN